MWSSVRMLSHAGKASASKITWRLVTYICIIKHKLCLVLTTWTWRCDILFKGNTDEYKSRQGIDCYSRHRFNVACCSWINLEDLRR
jgi:hypothetical protein